MKLRNALSSNTWNWTAGLFVNKIKQNQCIPNFSFTPVGRSVMLHISHILPSIMAICHNKTSSFTHSPSFLLYKSASVCMCDAKGPMNVVAGRGGISTAQHCKSHYRGTRPSATRTPSPSSHTYTRAAHFVVLNGNAFHCSKRHGVCHILSNG